MVSDMTDRQDEEGSSPSDEPVVKRRGVAFLSAWVAGLLLVSAVVALGYFLALGLNGEDVSDVESGLVLSVAHQLTDGPWQIYGPYGGRNPWVLIHPPLYYQISALLAWPLAQTGLDAVAASQVAGRGLSLLGLFVTVLFAYRLARCDGASGKAGIWAGLLVFAAPVLGVVPVMVRSDMVGIALQTAGTWLVLSSLHGGRSRAVKVVAAYVTFGVAVCVKQHFIASAAVSTALLLWACLRGHLRFRTVVCGLLTLFAIVLAFYGGEELLTSGRMSLAVFDTAAAVARIRPAGWPNAALISLEVSSESFGLTALLVAALFCLVLCRGGVFRWAFAAVCGAVLLTLIAAAVFPYQDRRQGIAAEILFYEHLLFIVFVPACFLLAPRTAFGGRLDAHLWAYWGAEAVVAVILFRSSTGAWTNYAIPAIVYASVLTARALARALDQAESPLPLVPVAVAAMGALVLVGIDIREDVNRRAEHRVAVNAVLDRLKPRPREVFFVDMPGENRIHGRPELSFDDWLYPVFESTHQAEYRSRWLGDALASRTIRYVVAKHPRPRIDGVDRTLVDMGFMPEAIIHGLCVWKQRRPVPPPG
jgi:hypothetical protein